MSGGLHSTVTYAYNPGMNTTTAPAARTATPTGFLPYRTITVQAAARQGLAPRRMTAEAMHDWLPADGQVVATWERIGNVHGAVVYGLFHFRRSQTPGHPGVETVRPNDGTVVVRYPLGQGRTVRVLGRASA